MSTEVSTRLDPEIFRLPVERIREGYYSDAYFVHTKSLLEAEGHHPRVTMQVFQKRESLLGGIDEAIAVLKLCSGRPGEDFTPESPSPLEELKNAPRPPARAL